MKVVSTVFLALMAASGVVSGPLQKRAEVTVTATETVIATVTVDAPGSSSKKDGHGKNKGKDKTPAEPETTLDEVTETPAEDTEGETAQVPDTEETFTTTDTGSSSGTDSSTSSDPVLVAALEHHNVHRSNHSSSDVAWDDDIAGYAAITAATCTFAHDTETGGGGYGQNIAMYASSGDVEEIGKDVFIGRTITEMWYNGEINLFPASDYGLDTPDMSDFSGWGHYTQVIWADTTSVGCAVQYCEPGTMVDGMGAYYSVCNYSPAGNVGGGYGDNVLPPEGAATFNAS